MKVSKNIRNDFPWFKENKNWVYLDSAATALKPQCLIDATVEYYRRWSTNPHNTDTSLTYHSVQAIAEIRWKIAKHFNVQPQEVIFTSGATESLNLFSNGIAHLVKPGDEVLVTSTEHTSNLLPWMDLCKRMKAKLIYANDEGSEPTTETIIKGLNKKTKIVAFANVSNLLGYEIDMQKIAKRAHQINKDMIVVVDGTQAVPHKPYDLKQSGVDLFACSAHKMCGATGIGLAYINQKYLKTLKPLRLGGGMNNAVNKYDYTDAESPDKFEGGTPNTAGIYTWGTVIDYLNSYGWDKIQKQEHELNKYLNQQLSKLTNIDWSNPNAAYPIVAFNIKGVHAQDVASYLGHKHIITRSGLSCVKLASQVICRPAVVRASFYFYNTKAEVDYLVKCIKEFKKEDIVKNVI